MGMTIEHAKKLLSVIVASISDDDYLTIKNENLQVFKCALLVLLEAVEDGKIDRYRRSKKRI